MKTLLSYILFLWAICLVACDDDNISADVPQTLAVEGWIENGEFPIVMVTKTLPVSTEYQNLDELSAYLVRWAKVTVSDGEKSVVLIGRYDDNYYPPYIYTTPYMRGELGKTYTLTVEYEGKTLSSYTTIPQTQPNLDRYRVEKCEGTEDQYQIKACFRDNPHEKNYYLFFVKTGAELTNHYLGAYMGAVNDDMISEYVEYPVYQGHQYNQNKYTPYFKAGDVVSVKFVQVDQSSWTFWDQYTKSQTLQSNMFLSTFMPLPSNIEGGTGYWSGLASVVSHLVIR